MKLIRLQSDPFGARDVDMAPPTINAQQWIINLDPCAGNRLIMNHSRGRRPSSFTRLWRNHYFYPLNFDISSNELISFKYAHEVALRQHHLLIAFHPSDACPIRSEDTRQIQNLRCVTFILFWGVFSDTVRGCRGHMSSEVSSSAGGKTGPCFEFRQSRAAT